MAELSVPAPPLGDRRRYRDAPKTVILAFWLWWPLILLQVVGLSWSSVSNVTFMIQYDLSVSDMAGQLIPALVGLAALIAESLLVFRLLRGSRAARGWLLGFAIVQGGLLSIVLLLTAGLSKSYGTPIDPTTFGLLTSLGIVTVLAFAGALVPFFPPADRYFAKKPKVSAPLAYPDSLYGPPESADEADTPPAPPFSG